LVGKMTRLAAEHPGMLRPAVGWVRQGSRFGCRCPVDGEWLQLLDRSASHAADDSGRSTPLNRVAMPRRSGVRPSRKAINGGVKAGLRQELNGAM
jgi:hypothetical protein